MRHLLSVVADVVIVVSVAVLELEGLRPESNETLCVPLFFCRERNMCACSAPLPPSPLLQPKQAIQAAACCLQQSTAEVMVFNVSPICRCRLPIASFRLSLFSTRARARRHREREREREERERDRMERQRWGDNEEGGQVGNSIVGRNRKQNSSVLYHNLPRYKTETLIKYSTTCKGERRPAQIEKQKQNQFAE